MSDPLLIVRQPKPEYVYVIDDEEVVSDVMEDFHAKFPEMAKIVSGCMCCDQMILTCWPAKDLPPVLTLACPGCLRGLLKENQDFVERN
jgi:hypothetical protein